MDISEQLNSKGFSLGMSWQWTQLTPKKVPVREKFSKAVRGVLNELRNILSGKKVFEEIFEEIFFQFEPFLRLS